MKVTTSLTMRSLTRIGDSKFAQDTVIVLIDENDLCDVATVGELYR